MRRFSALLITFFLVIPVFISAQQRQDKLNSQLIDEKGKALDKEIIDLYKLVEGVIANSDIMSPDGVKFLPYQTDIIYGPDYDPKKKDNKKPEYFELIKHIYIRAGIFSGRLVGYEEKTLRIYSNGKTINKMEAIIKVRNFQEQSEEILTVVDSSPTSGSKDNIILTHVRNGRTVVDKKKLGDILNNIDLPIANEIKSDFMIPTLVTLYKNILFITEVNLKNSKDVDANVADFLKKSTFY